MNNYAVFLRKHGISCEIITLCDTKKWESPTRLHRKTVDGTQAIVWPSYPIGQLRIPLTLMLNVHFFPAHPTVLASHLRHFDVLHLHDNVDLSFPLSCLRLRRPKIFTCHTANLGVFRRNPVSRRLLTTSADLFHVFSKVMAEELCELGIRKEKIRVLPHGVDVNQFKPSRPDVPRDSLRIVFVSRITREKGIDNLLEATQILGEEYSSTRHVEVLVVGDVWDSAYYEELLRYRNRMRLQEVKFMGPVDPKSLPELLRQSDIFVCPSRSEAFGLVNLEAMASGLPVVATSVGATPDVVVENQTGFLVPPGDSEALAERLFRLVSDDHLRESMGRKGRNRAESMFSMDRIGLELLRIYRELA